MSLDAVRMLSTNDAVEHVRAFEKWRDFPISKISHHGKICCETAREWIFAMDFSSLNGASVLTGPRWIRQKYNWGPTQWAIYWCQAVQQLALDCGAQAAIANEVFQIRGVQSYQIQLVQEYSKEATDQWSEKWNGAETSIHWINEHLIYHEGCAVVVGENQIKIWDASSGWWINPQQSSGYGGLRAVRLYTTSNDSTIFVWGNHQIAANQWQEIKSF